MNKRNYVYRFTKSENKNKANHKKRRHWNRIEMQIIRQILQSFPLHYNFSLPSQSFSRYSISSSIFYIASCQRFLFSFTSRSLFGNSTFVLVVRNSTFKLSNSTDFLRLGHYSECYRVLLECSVLQTPTRTVRMFQIFCNLMTFLKFLIGRFIWLKHSVCNSRTPPSLFRICGILSPHPHDGRPDHHLPYSSSPLLKNQIRFKKH